MDSDAAGNGTKLSRGSFRCLFSDVPISYEYINAEANADRMSARMMALVVEGRPNKLIADALAISVRTIEVHRSRVFEKMGVSSAVALANLLREADAD